MSKFIFTCGDTNGIGPEIVIKTLNKILSADVPQRLNQFIFICPKNVFDAAASVTPVSFDYEVLRDLTDISESVVTILDIKNPELTIGKPTKDSGKSAFRSIRLSFKILNQKKADAVITAPISKAAIKQAGFNYPGHTEMYAEWCSVKNFLMMFISKELNAALATIHEPIKKVPGLLTYKRVRKKIETAINSLVFDLNIKAPRIAILGLNPHAGEEGLIGTEDKKILEPLINEKKFSKYLSGPFSPDAFFGCKNYKNFDLVMGMYHDQVLIPFKLLNFSSGVNYTAGLPIVRTSPDHGTAFDIAGKNLADESSIFEAYKLAEKIVNNRKENAFRKNL